MTRTDIINAMADALQKSPNDPLYDGASEYAETAKAALTAIEALGVRLVPVDGTPEMFAFYGAIPKASKVTLWADMLMASPLRPDEEAEGR